MASLYSYLTMTPKAVTASIGIQLINFSLSYFLSFDNFTGFMNFSTLFIASFFVAYNINGSNNYAFKQLFITFLGILWNLRLTYYLVIRIIRRGGQDTRMDRMRAQGPLTLAQFWVVHASWCLIVSLPVTLVNTLNVTFKSAPNDTKFALNSDELYGTSFSMMEIIGIVIYLYGLIVESLADHSKLEHWQSLQTMQNNNKKNSKNNVATFCNRSIWRYSRNPNFGGEIILWFGMALLSSTMIFNTFRRANDSGLLGVSLFTQYLIGYLPYLAPIFTATVLLFLSGANLHEWKDQKLNGKNKEYIEYRKKTSPVWPCPPSIYANILPDFIKTTVMCEWQYYVRKERKGRKKNGKHL